MTTESPIVPAWWTLLLGSGILGQISFRTIIAGAKDVKDLQMAAYVQPVNDDVDIFLCLVAIALTVIQFPEAGIGISLE